MIETRAWGRPKLDEQKHTYEHHLNNCTKKSKKRSTRSSLPPHAYANGDAQIFIELGVVEPKGGRNKYSLNRKDASMINVLLELFGKVTGLRTNMAKSVAMPIRCEGHDLQHILQPLRIPNKGIPCTYLGMPLALRSLTKIDLQPPMDKFNAKIPAWKGALMAKTGRVVLLKAVLSTMAIYMSSMHKLLVWVRNYLIKRCRAWLWRGEGSCNGGHCQVNWTIVSKPKNMGGLGVLDFAKFGRALRLRWLWFSWKEPQSPWVGSGLPCDDTDRELFAAATEITIRDGATARFWSDRWLLGQSPKTIAPALFKISRRKTRSIREALKGD